MFRIHFFFLLPQQLSIYGTSDEVTLFFLNLSVFFFRCHCAGFFIDQFHNRHRRALLSQSPVDGQKWARQDRAFGSRTLCYIHGPNLHGNGIPHGLLQCIRRRPIHSTHSFHHDDPVLRIGPTNLRFGFDHKKLNVTNEITGST